MNKTSTECEKPRQKTSFIATKENSNMTKCLIYFAFYVIDRKKNTTYTQTQRCEENVLFPRTKQ